MAQAAASPHAAEQARRDFVHRRVRLVKGYAQSAPFAMGKFALRGLAQSMARELPPQGIHVAHFVIDGGIKSARRAVPADAPDPLLDPDAIAQSLSRMSCNSRAAPGPTRSSYDRGSRSSSAAEHADHRVPIYERAAAGRASRAFVVQISRAQHQRTRRRYTPYHESHFLSPMVTGAPDLPQTRIIPLYWPHRCGRR